MRVLRRGSIRKDRAQVNIDWIQLFVGVVFSAGLLFCGAVIAFAVVHLAISVWEMWRDWFRARRRPKF